MTGARSGSREFTARQWPPAPYPPREPNPRGDDLLDPVDWMTYSHRELHLMATTRLHLDTARELSGDWSRVGRKLDAIADKLVRLNKLMGTAWEGAAAEVARRTGTELSTWADETGRAARGVADYLDRHASNAEWASREMPEPDGDGGLGWLPNWRRDDPDDDPGAPGPKPTAGGGGGGTTPSAAGQVDFEAARFLVEDEGEARERRQRRHRRAAEIMSRMQANAAEIFGTIPRFTTPAVSGRGGEDRLPDPGTEGSSFGATTAAGHPGVSGGTAGGTGGVAVGGPDTSAPGGRAVGNGPGAPASGVPGMTGGSPGLDDGRARGAAALGTGPVGGPAATGGTDRRGGPVGLVSPRAHRGGGDDAERRSRALVGGDATVFEQDENPAPEIVAGAGHEEAPPSPVDDPPPPISLARLPGNWVGQGARSAT